MDNRQNYVLHIVLFLVTVVTTCVAGAEWVTAKSLYLTFIEPRTLEGFLPFCIEGIPYAASFLGFLTFHEFGHYFTARWHGVKSSLPYYIPFFIPFFPINIGSMGAVIRLRQSPASTRQFFDIGIAGPLAGFVVALGLLVYGLTHLPEPEAYVLNIHPEYTELFGGLPTEKEYFQANPGGTGLLGPFVGSNLLFELLKWLLVSDPSRFPPSFELMHYPFLLVGFLTLFFTALNLLPIGQLDGGHILFGMFGSRISGLISRFTVTALVLVGGTGLANVFDISNPYRFAVLGFYLLYVVWASGKLFPKLDNRFRLAGILILVGLQVGINYAFVIQPSYIWLFYSFISIRLLGIDHPPVMYEQPLGRFRMVLGWIAILIFILCFSPSPIYFL